MLVRGHYPLRAPVPAVLYATRHATLLAGFHGRELGGGEPNLINPYVYRCLMKSESCLLLVVTSTAGRSARAI